MKAAILFLTTLFFFVLSTKSTMAASTNIRVSSTGNSSSSVKVNSNTSSSSTSESSTTSETRVVINSNGETKEYNSTGEDIVVDEDNVKVTVKNSGKTSTGSPTPKTLNDEAKEKVQQKVKGAQTEAKKTALEKKKEAAKKLGEIRDTQKGNLLNRIELFFSDFKKRFFE